MGKVAMGRGGLLWGGEGCYGEGRVVMGRGGLLWGGEGCYGEELGGYGVLCILNSS